MASAPHGGILKVRRVFLPIRGSLTLTLSHERTSLPEIKIYTTY
jgi:hypothetical protein